MNVDEVIFVLALFGIGLWWIWVPLAGLVVFRILKVCQPRWNVPASDNREPATNRE